MEIICVCHQNYVTDFPIPLVIYIIFPNCYLILIRILLLLESRLYVSVIKTMSLTSQFP